MSLRGFLRPLAIATGVLLAASASYSAGQETTPTPAPAAPQAGQALSPASTVPAPPAAGTAPQRLSDEPVTRVDRLPADNPFGVAAEKPAALPPKPFFTEQPVETSLFATVHVDKTGKVIGAERIRDPIPSLAADSKKSFDRWTFDPASKDGQPVETWASVRVEMSAMVKPPKIEQMVLRPIEPSTPIPAPLEWTADQTWYDAAPVGHPPGGIAIEQADTIAAPKKTKWDADSYKGPFSIRMWVKIDAAGRAARTVPMQASDPLLIPYFRNQIATWQFQPATVNGVSAESWGELLASGTISWSAEVKQIANLRKTLTAAAPVRH